MRWFVHAVQLSVVVLLVPSPALAAEQVVTIEAKSPSVPTPFQAAVIGLCLTAVAVIGARVVKSTPNTMMYLVLGALAITATMVAYSDRVHDNFVKAGLNAVQKEAAKPRN